MHPDVNNWIIYYLYMYYYNKNIYLKKHFLRKQNIISVGMKQVILVNI